MIAAGSGAYNPGPTERIEDTYPLSSMQQGMLFNSLYNPGAGVDFEQMIITLHEEVDASLLRQAWLRVVERHAVLRTAFRWEEATPLQEVYAGVIPPWQEYDWRDIPSSEREERLEQFLQEDRRSGFDLRCPPLMRLTLFRLNEAEYRLVWSFHHALLDGRAFVLVLKEVFAFYHAFREGADLQLEEPRRFRDYITWLERQDITQAEAYWRTSLSEVDGITSLSTVRSREQESQASEHEVQEIRLSADLTARIRLLAERHDLTPNTILQGAWAVLLSRYTGKDDVVFGVTRACRKSALGGADSVVGLFINTLPLRTTIPAAARVLPWLRDLRALNVAVRPYEHTPLVSIQHWHKAEGNTPLFDTLLVFENFSLNTALRSQGGDWEHRHFELREKTNYPITVNAYLDTELRIRLAYDHQRLNNEAAARMLGHLQTLIEAIVTDPEQPISHLSLLTEPERRQLLVDWNATGAHYPHEPCIHRLFEEQVERTPNAVALVCEEEQLTYAKLNARANQLAHYLRSLGVGPEVLVGLCVERSVEMVVGLLGILKAGGAYVPLDPTYPPQRLAFMLTDSQVSLLLTQASLSERVVTTTATKVCLDTEAGMLALQSEADLVCRNSSKNLAYVIYTSGSTGQPKGVALTHRSAAALLQWAGHTYTQEELAGVLACTSLCFDLSVFEVFVPLSRGGCVLLADNALALPTLAWRDQVRLLNTVPSAMAALVQAGAVPGSVRTVNLAGEPLSTELVGRLYAAGVEKVYDLYGPSEDTTYSTFALRSAQGPATIGRPIANTQVYLLDANQQLVPVGVVGELSIGGAGLARGYWQRAGLTAEKFVPDPFSGEAGARLYRTGDLARYLPDGNLEFLGRVDHQVKVRGFRIELGEIESVLLAHPGVREAVVLAREDNPGDKRLVAYVVSAGEEEPGSGSGLSGSVLREHLKAKLPEYMVPSSFVFLERLPLSANGKIERKALPAPEAGSETGQEYVPPRNPIEEGLAGVFGAVLGLEQVSVATSFFALGGHSLLATQVISRIRTLFGVELGLRVLFEAPTVAELAARVEAARQEQVDTVPVLAPMSREGALPLSFAQQRLWFAHQLDPLNPAYNVPCLLRIQGSLSVPALQRAIEMLVIRHAVLRTTYVEEDGIPTQVVSSTIETPFKIVDLSGMDEVNREQEALRSAVDEIRLPFDLSRGPILRCTLYQLSLEDHLLALTIHHIASDGWSLGVIAGEIGVLYKHSIEKSSSSLSDLPIQYTDYAIWERLRLKTEEMQEQLSYWRKQLEDIPQTMNLPLDRPRPPVQSLRGATLTAELDGNLVEGLRSVGRREGATLFMVLLACFKVLMYCTLDEEDIVVGTDVAGRNRMEFEGLIGFFVNNLVLRTNLSGNPSFLELISRVRQMALEAYSHQDVPFDRLVEELQPERDPSHMPLFQILFVMQNTPLPVVEHGSISLRPVDIENSTSKFDLALFFQESQCGIEQRLQGHWVYSIDLFDTITIRRMAERFETVVSLVTSRPEMRLADIKQEMAAADLTRRQVEKQRRATANYARFQQIKPQSQSIPSSPSEDIR